MLTRFIYIYLHGEDNENLYGINLVVILINNSVLKK